MNLFTHSPKVNTVLTAVGLGENKVGYTGAAAIAEAQLLDFDPDTFSLLASVVAFRSSHSDLGPDYNPNPKPDPNSGPTTNPRPTLTQALRMNATLQHLDLECNKVGDAGAAAIASALCANKALRVLSFSSNDKTYRATACAVPTRRASYIQPYIHACNPIHYRCSTSVLTVSVTQGLLRWLKVRQ